MALRTLRDRVTADRPLNAIEITKSDSLSLSDAWIGCPSRVAGPSAVAPNHSLRVGSTTTPTDGAAVDDQADRHAEDRDPVRIVHGAVEGVDDPDPAAARRGRLARDGPMLAGLLGQDRVVRVALSERLHDERLGEMVRLGHDVASALVVDLFEPLVMVHQDDPRLAGEIPGEVEIVRQRGHGELHSTVRSRTVEPSSTTRLVNVSVSPGWTCGLRMKPSRPPLRSAGSETRQVVWPTLVP